MDSTFRHPRRAGARGSFPPTPPSRAEDSPRGYRLTRLIARGGMGEVYEAVQENPRRVVAIKVVRDPPAHRARFEREIHILAQLRHPGIPSIIESGVWNAEYGPAPFFALEYVSGARPITEYADAYSLSLRHRLLLFQSACEAVAHCHRRGVVHRDLKPANLPVDSCGRARLIDFGVARTGTPLPAEIGRDTFTGQLIGTVAYMSPEQCAGDPRDLDARSDVYSLGVVLY